MKIKFNCAYHSNPYIFYTYSSSAWANKAPPAFSQVEGVQQGGQKRPEERSCSEMGRALGRVLSALAGNRPASLLPNGETITGADLLGVLEEASRACNDATGQPVEGCVVSTGPPLGTPGSTSTAGTAQPPVEGGTTHLSPEFPVTLDRGWPPRPRSSSPSSITRLRPITSHTFERRQQPQPHRPVKKGPHLLLILLSAAHPLAGKWLGHQHQRGHCPGLHGAGMRTSREEGSHRVQLLSSGVPVSDSSSYFPKKLNFLPVGSRDSSGLRKSNWTHPPWN